MNRTVLIAVVAIMALVGGFFFLTAFMDIVVIMGHNIPQEDMATDYIIGVSWAMFLGMSILVWPVAHRDKRNLLWAWSAKCLVTLGFMLVYENHYPTDAMGYFDWARSPDYVWNSFVIGDGTENIMRLIHLHTVVFPDSFHMTKVTFSLVGFIALYLIYRAGVTFTREDDNRVFYAMMLFPTHIFWSSILGKDPVILLGIGLYVLGVAGWYRTNRFRYLLLIAVGLFETSFIRVWMSSILLAPLAVFFIARMRGMLSRIAFICLVIAGFVWAQGRFRQKFNIETQQDLVRTADVTVQSWAFGGSAQSLDGSMESVSDMAMFLPLGMTTALLRPLPGEVANLFGTLAGLENLTFIFILLYALVRTRWRDLLEPMVLWAILLVIAWSASYSFASYQNLGTAARFKMQIMPIFLGLIMYLSRRRQPPAPIAAPAALSLAGR